LCRLTGAEAATVVNNNAAAVMLCLNTMAEGKDVIISRGQLIEIGGSFRLPEVVAKSGARLVEVGTTNRTYLKDYEKAITGETGALLCCHPSNFIVVGFSADVPIEEIVELGLQYNVPVVYDLGSGALVDLSEYGLEKEPMVQESVEHGVHLITFSGDKLLGGPQAGIIVGKRDCVEQVKKNPLKRALRIDKNTIAALEATLRIYLSEPDLLVKLPIVWFLTRPIEEIEESASEIVKALSKRLERKVEISVQDGFSRVGGGSLPVESLPTKLIALKSIHISPDELAARLRACPVPILGRIQQDTVLLDVRTIRKNEQGDVREALLNLNYE
jgi:L-seryl-tRNA(Ser) seleniumtransferase